MKGKVLFDCFWYLEVASSIIQWYKDDVMLNDTTNIAGTSTNFLSVSDIAGSDFGLYQCYVEDFLSKAVVLTGVLRTQMANILQCMILSLLTQLAILTYLTQSTDASSQHMLVCKNRHTSKFLVQAQVPQNAKHVT